MMIKQKEDGFIKKKGEEKNRVTVNSWVFDVQFKHKIFHQFQLYS